jgi:signal transduction histidine kinase
LLGDSRNATAFVQNLADAETHYRRAATMLASHPGQPERMRRVGEGMERYFARLHEIVDARNAQGLPGVMRVVEQRHDVGEALSLRSEIDAVLDAERLAFAERVARDGEREREVHLTSVGVGVGAFAIMFGVLLLQRRDRLRLLDARARLELAKEQLEMRVAERTREVVAERTRVELMLEATSDGIAGFDPDLRVTFLSRRGGEILQRDPTAVRGKLLGEVSAAFAGSAWESIFRRALDRQETQQGELELPGGKGIWFYYYLAPIEGGITVFFRDVTRRRQQEEQLREYAERMGALTRYVIAAEEAHRRALARELHDDIGQSLAALKFDLTAMRENGDLRMVRTATDALRELDRVIEQVRDRALELRPALLEDQGLAAAVREYAERTARRFGVAINVRAQRPDARLRAEQEVAAFRLVQESIQNALHHAQCSRIEVDIEIDEEQLSIAVRDDGQGFDVAAAASIAAQRRRMGLEGMHERVALLGGRFRVDSRPGTGAVVRASLPAARVEALA